MKDIFGNSLEVGDTVAINPPYYKGLVKGVILKFTPKSVLVEHDSNYGSQVYVSPKNVAKEIKS